MSAVVETTSRPFGLARAVALPRVGTSAAVSAMTMASLAPGLLPRTAAMQAVVTGLFVAVGLGIGRAVRGSDVVRAVGLALGLLGVGWAFIAADRWQDGLRAAMGAPPLGPGYWVQVWAGAGVVALALYGTVKLLGATARTLGPALMVAATVATAVVGVPALVDWRTSSYSAANAFIDPDVQRPMSVAPAAWERLGAEGRKFVGGKAAGASVRVYAGISSAPDLDSRVALAVRELEQSGGLARSNIVVAIPTGSGWIDSKAVTGFERRFHDDVAIVGVQYSYAPSWATFVFGRRAAQDSASALVDAVAERIATLSHKPNLYVYGQSLGAIGGSQAVRGIATCGTLWAGPPAGAVERGTATVLANSSDPVIRWSPRLLFAPPDLSGARPDAPAPQWLPVVSYLQTAVDLLSALDAPAGHGHRYGTDQGTAMPSC